jgi:two-component system chemotaxis response regulator CheB
MAAAPTPVIVISSYAQKAEVFRALELGAFDFIAKPGAKASEHELFKQDLLAKVRAVRLIRPPVRRSSAAYATPKPLPDEPRTVLAIAASTGGPPAVQSLLDALARAPSLGVLVCQHMPPRFTEAFAERLDRRGSFRVSEAKDGDLVEAGKVFIAPGGQHLTVAARGGGLRLVTTDAVAADKCVPSADRLFESLALVVGPRAVGVVLTGMGADGAVGTTALHRVGAVVWAESEETAIIFGMPKEAIATGGVSRVLALPQLGPALLELARSRS